MNVFSLAAETAAGWQPALEIAGAVAAKTLPQVIEGLRTWVMGILAAVATLFLVIGGLLAPVVLQVLQGILGG